MSIVKKIVSFFLLFAFLLLVSGCWDKKEIDKRAYVIAIGMDIAETEGMVKISYIIANPEYGSVQQSGSTNEPSNEILTIPVTNFISSRDIANSIIAKSITYDLLDVIVVSEKMARDKDFIRWIYDATKDREIRRDTKLVVTKEDASVFLKNNKPKLETRIHEYYELILQNANEIGLISQGYLNTFFRITEADADLFLAVYATTEKIEDPSENPNTDEVIAGHLNVKGKTNPTQFMGSAVFKEGKMIGTLTAEETRLVQMLNKQMENSKFFTTFPDPFQEDTYLAARIIERAPAKVKIDFSNKPPKISAKLPLTVEILTDHSMVNYAKHKDKRDQLKKHVKEMIEKRYVELVNKTQEELKGQPFGFSLVARKHFLTIPEWEAYDWMKTYPNADVKITVDIRFDEFGRQSELPKFNEIRD